MGGRILYAGWEERFKLFFYLFVGLVDSRQVDVVGG